MKYYIVYFDSITQYGKTNKGYYVSYKDKLEDEYSDNYILAKRYKTLGPTLNRLGMRFKGFGAKDFIDKLEWRLENSQKAKRRKKLSKIDNKIFQINDSDYEFIDILNNKHIEILEINGNEIKNLGRVSNKEIYDYINKEAEKFLKQNPYYKTTVRRNSTQEEIDDFLKL